MVKEEKQESHLCLTDLHCARLQRRYRKVLFSVDLAALGYAPTKNTCDSSVKGKSGASAVTAAMASAKNE